MKSSEISSPQASEQRLLTIGEAADLLGISVPTLRMYEREGLIIPFRRGSRHRRFSQRDIERISCMRGMITREKVSIEGIKRLLSLIPCWKIRNCPEDVRLSCKAFQQQSKPCWLVSEKSWDCRRAECRLCPVYSTITDCAALKGTIARFTLSDCSPAGGKRETA